MSFEHLIHPELPHVRPDLGDFVDCWGWLFEHPAFFYAGDMTGKCEPGFAEALDVYMYRDDDGQPVVMLEVGGFTDPVDEWESKNPKFVQTGVPGHDPNLDSQGPTFEAALVSMASTVMAVHGVYVEHRICSHCLANRPAGPTDEHVEWFCSESCAACGPVGLVLDGEDDSGFVRWVPPSEQFDCEHWSE